MALTMHRNTPDESRLDTAPVRRADTVIAVIQGAATNLISRTMAVPVVDGLITEMR